MVMKQHPARKALKKGQHLLKGQLVTLRCGNGECGTVTGHTSEGGVLVKWHGKRRRYQHNPRYLVRV